MRKTMIAVAATAGFLTLGTLGASAAPLMPMNDVVTARLVEGPNAFVQQADWYCGPRCQYWHHRRWEERHHWYGYRYGYNGYRGYYGSNGYYYR